MTTDPGKTGYSALQRILEPAAKRPLGRSTVVVGGRISGNVCETELSARPRAGWPPLGSRNAKTHTGGQGTSPAHAQGASERH